jgi:hypothetical protein
MVALFHVLVTERGKEPAYLLGDLDARELRRRFLRPYRAGGRFVVGNVVVDLSHLERVQIIRTAKPKEQELERIRKEDSEATDRFNAESRSSGFVFMGNIGFGNRDTDIAHAGPDVTGEFIMAPPGSGNPVLRFISNHWTVTVIGGIIAAVVAGLILFLAIGA